MKIKLTQQKPGTDWQDEAGNWITPANLTRKEKAFEKITYQVAKAAVKANENLVKLKAFIKQNIQKAIEAFHAEYEGKKTNFKGNYTFTNFDGSIKVIVSVSSPIRFDDLTIQRAKGLLDEFLKDGLSAKNAAIKDMVLSAFETRRGQMDVKKILALKRYADRIKDSRYSEAMSLIDQAIRRPDTATYYRIEVRNEEGKYENIPLSLSEV